MRERARGHYATSKAVRQGGNAHEVALPQAGEKHRPVNATTRKPNAAYRVREHLTEAEMDKLLAALRHNRHGQRDWLIGLLIYRHGLRVSEACDLRWDDLDYTKRTRARIAETIFTKPVLRPIMRLPNTAKQRVKKVARLSGLKSWR